MSGFSTRGSLRPLASKLESARRPDRRFAMKHARGIALAFATALATGLVQAATEDQKTMVYAAVDRNAERDRADRRHHLLSRRARHAGGGRREVPERNA